MKVELWKSPTKRWAQCSPKRQEALYEAWSTGNIFWKLDPVQRAAVDHVYEMHASVKSSLERIHVLEFSRRGGKDQCMCTMAVSDAMKARSTMRIPYAAPTREACKDIIAPTLMQLFEDCPPELLPYEIKRGTFLRSANELNFDNGAQIQLVGVDLHPEWLRGTATACAFFTEPAFVDGLEHLMKSILLPQMLTNPDGFMVMGSTPPITPGHFWSVDVVPKAKLRGMYRKHVLYEFEHRLGADQIRGMEEALGGKESTQFRRECLCEHVTEATNMVVTEFPDVKDKVVTEEGFDRPPEYRDTYVSLDPGFAHATGAVFGWFDFERQTMMIEGAFKVQGKNTAEVARRVKAREWQLWGRAPEKPRKLTDEAWAEELELIRSHFYKNLAVAKPVVTHLNGSTSDKTYRRVSDTASQVIADMANEHGLLFFATAKDDLDAAVASLRLNVQRIRYKIHPRCVELITDLEQAVWNKDRTKFAEGAGGHHYDTLPAMIYLNRNVTWNRNPFPPHQYNRHSHHVPTASKTASALTGLFRRGRR